MRFDDVFFEDEVICEFPVSTMLKRGWAAAIEVLEEVDSICKKHNIQYFAEWGTLLGAVRHKGFIPWDDDLDISMKRADYERFLSVAENELPENYTVHHIMKQDRHGAAIAGVFDCDRICISKRFLEKHHDCPAAIGLDIFVHDYLPKDPEVQKQQAEALDFLVSLIAQYDDLSEDEKKHQLKLVKTSLGADIKMGNPQNSVTMQLGRLLESICKLYNENESDELCNMMVWQHWKKYHFPKEWFDEVIYGDFMGFKIPMPKEYKKYLELMFGDYMKEVRSGSSHSFPYFEANYRFGRNMLGFDEYLPESMELPRTEQQKKAAEKILFLPCQAKHWDEMSPIYKREVDRDDTEVYIVALPYFKKNYKGEKVEICYEGEEFPYELPIIHYDYFDLDMEHPDKIYFQIPWDQYHEIIEVPDYYFVRHLRMCCDELIYVPFNQVQPFPEEDERTAKMLHYSCRYPGILDADRIEVSEEKRGNYLKVLTTFTGEETKEIWKYKLRMKE